MADPRIAALEGRLARACPANGSTDYWTVIAVARDALALCAVLVKERDSFRERLIALKQRAWRPRDGEGE